MATVLLELLVLDANCPPLFNYSRQKTLPFVHKLVCLGFSIVCTQTDKEVAPGSRGTGPRNEVRALTDEVEEGEADEEVGGPVEAAAEGEGPPSDLRRVDLAEDQPGH